MCGRYFIADDALTEYDIQALNRAAGQGADITPGMDAPTMVAESRSIEMMRWGFERERGGLVINARVETMGEKPMFRGLAESQRCAMPASRYYEWRRADRQKFTIGLRDVDLFWLAGLYRVGPDGNEFVVLTQPPVDAIQGVHNRMPLILPDKFARHRWLNGEMPLFANNRAIRIEAEGAEQLMMRF